MCGRFRLILFDIMKLGLALDDKAREAATVRPLLACPSMI